jgi:hypothetical protein
VSGPFLPFTPNGKATELQAIAVKSRLGVGATAAVDPYAVLHRLPARLVDAAALREQDGLVACALLSVHADEWSAVCFGRSEITGEALILLNPTHAATRQKATLMEEVVHIVLDHPPSRLMLNGVQGGAERRYEAAIEDEAYTVGAACLLPYPALFRAVNDTHESAAVIAARYGVSRDYVTFRIKRAGLVRIYNKHCTPLQGA